MPYRCLHGVAGVAGGAGRVAKATLPATPATPAVFMATPPKNSRKATLWATFSTPGNPHPSCHPFDHPGPFPPFLPPFPPLGPTVYNDRQRGQICNSSEGGREWKRRGEEGSEGKRGEGRKDRRGRGVRKEYTKNKDSWWYWPFFVILMEV